MDAGLIVAAVSAIVALFVVKFLLKPQLDENLGRRVDFMFLIDGSGSMQPCMEALQASINIFLDEFSGGQSPLRDWRSKVVTYRDHQLDGDRWFEDNPFVRSDEKALKSQLDAVEAEGGGDGPKSLLDALHKIALMEQAGKGAQELDPHKWRFHSDADRVVIVFTDATYHPIMTYPEGSTGTVDDVSTAILASKIILMLFTPDHEQYDELNSLDESEWEPIPKIDGSFAKGLEEFVKDQTNFRKVLVSLAKSVSHPLVTLID